MKKESKIKQKFVYNYNVIIEKDEKSGFFASVPNLPGCYSQGKTIEKTIENIGEAIQLYLEVSKNEGIKIPRQSFVSLTSITVSV